MFKKLHNIKTTSAVRSSDRRKLIQEINLLFNYEFKSYQLDLVLPKALTISKFTSSGGKSGSIYMTEKEAVWFRTDDAELLPTVYTLWCIPDLVPILYTNNFVIKKLIDGADLMIPGIYVPEEGLPQLKAGDIVSICNINEQGSSNLSLGVGKLIINSKEIKEGEKGKAVTIIHTYSDHLWEMGSKISPDDFKLPELPNEAICADEQLEDKFESLNVQENESDLKENLKLSTSEIDELFLTTLYQVLTTSLDAENSKSLLPLSISTLLSDYMLPSRPKGVDLNIKDSSYKKFSKFMKFVEKKGVLSLKEIKGDVYIKSINYSFPELVGYVPLKKNKLSLSNSNKESSLPTNNKKIEQDIKEPISIFNVYKSNAAFAPLFENKNGQTLDNDKKFEQGIFTKKDILDSLKNYIKEKQLESKSDRRVVKLDEFLSDLILKSEEKEKTIYLTREQLNERIFNKIDKYYHLKVPGKDPTLRKGEPTPIKVKIETRSGNKQVTLITNFEEYGFDPNELVKEFMSLCACSVSTTLLPTKKTKFQPSEVLIQGRQDKAVLKYFEDLGIPRDLLSVEIKMKKKK